MIGPEKRVLGYFRDGNIDADKYIIFINQGYKDNKFVIEYKSEILNVHLKGKNYQVIETFYNDPLHFTSTFNKIMNENEKDYFGEDANIEIDISTFNRQNMFVLLRLLRKTHKVNSIKIIYTIPREVNENISKGAAGYSNIPFFNGAFQIEKKKLLLLLVGYEIDRPLLLWKELEPSHVILASGYEPTSEEFLPHNNEIVEELGKFGKHERAEINANDPFKAQQQLCTIINERKDEYNIFISPMNTKLQAVGLYLAWEKYPQIQIVTAYPDKFSEWLTKGIKEIRKYRI